MSAAPASSAQLQTSAPPRHLRVLYADDLAELRDIVRLSLSRDGHGVECVADGQFALNRVTADPGFDLVITDHHMPNMNGLELVRGLKALPFRGRIMVFSSELSNAIADEYRRVGVDRILYKPVYPSVMREVIEQLFEPGK
jgi:two-component system chemotaxis response regulator CheY